MQQAHRQHRSSDDSKGSVREDHPRKSICRHRSAFGVKLASVNDAMGGCPTPPGAAWLFLLRACLAAPSRRLPPTMHLLPGPPPPRKRTWARSPRRWSATSARRPLPHWHLQTPSRLLLHLQRQWKASSRASSASAASTSCCHLSVSVLRVTTSAIDARHGS